MLPDRYRRMLSCERNRRFGCSLEQHAVESKQVLMSFVTRIWLEPGTNGDPIWRGHARHVQSNEECYFQDLGTLNEFLARVSGLPGFRPTGRLPSEAGSP